VDVPSPLSTKVETQTDGFGHVPTQEGGTPGVTSTWQSFGFMHSQSRTEISKPVWLSTSTQVGKHSSPSTGQMTGAHD
jgi:hypothetical protein